MTSEQYTGVMPRQINALSVSKDTLNPLLNTTILKQRLAAIDYYNNGYKQASRVSFHLQVDSKGLGVAMKF